MITNHWGKWVNPSQPVGGVVSIHSVEWLDEEVDADSIDLSWESYRAEWFSEKLAAFQLRNGYDREPSPRTMGRWAQAFENESQFYEASEPQYLIGSWVKDNDGLYIPDKSGDYSAIVSYNAFMCVQVVWSKYATRAALCSPCFPGQADLDTAGDYLAYDLPLDLYGGDRRNPNRQVELGRAMPGKILVYAQQTDDQLLVRTNSYTDFDDCFTHQARLTDGDTIAMLYAESNVSADDMRLRFNGYVFRFYIPDRYLDLIAEPIDNL